MGLQDRPIGRRELFGMFGGLAAGTLFGPPGAITGPFVHPGWGTPAGASALHHLSWVWEFGYDGDPAPVRDDLAAHGLGIVLKTHDGPEWMSKYDTGSSAVAGPGTVAYLANFFEQAGVPFHAWAVVTGEDVEREATMASQVLDSGARSLFLDIEGNAGFWTGSADLASRLGERLRTLQPSAHLSMSVDPRPWELDRVPLEQFAAFVDEVSPQVYWRTFGTAANIRRYLSAGTPVGLDGITPGFIIGAAMPRLGALGLPVHFVGDGSASPSSWDAFIRAAYAAGAETVSAWRYGLTSPQVLNVLRDTPPLATSYTVQPGDTLGSIAAQWGTTIEAVAAANDVADPNVIAVGMELRRPGTHPTRSTNSSGSGQSYTVEPGDTLAGIADAFGCSLDALVAGNGIEDPNLVVVGQELRIP